MKINEMVHSIRTRLALTYLIIILLIFGVVTLITTHYLKDYLIDYTRQQLTNKAFLSAESISSYIQQQPNLVSVSQLAEDLSVQLNARVLILNNELEVIGDSVRVGGLLNRRLQRQETLTALQGSVDYSIQFSEDSQQWVLQLAIPLLKDNETAVGVLFLSSSLSQSFTILDFVGRLLLYAALAATIIAVAVSLILTNSISKPLLLLARAAGDLGRGQLDRRVPVRGKDELAAVSIQFNRMAEQVEEYTGKLKEFVADASHELRTPLTSLRLQVQSLKDYPMTEEERDGFLQDMEAELERLSNLVNDLLALSRLDRKERVALKPIDLTQIIEHAVSKMAPQIEAAGLDFRSNLTSGPVNILGDSDLLEEVFMNLLENAQKYTPCGGLVTVNILPRSEEAVVEIADTGIGIPLPEQEKIFERFYRVDKTRSRAEGGTGLGLAIAREIISSHGGRIWVESAEEGSRFYVVFPRNVK